MTSKTAKSVDQVHPSDESLEVSKKRILKLQISFAIVLLVGGLIFNIVSLSIAGESISMDLNDIHTKAFLKSLIGLGYGCLLGIGNTLISARSVLRASDAVLTSPKFAMAPVFSGLVNKLLMVGGGIAVGLIVFKLPPMMVVAGYLAVQIAFVWASVRQARVPNQN